MNPVTHFLISWGVASAVPRTTRRERGLVALGGIVPDVDGLGAVPDVITRFAWGYEHSTRFFHDYHHLLHSVSFAAVWGAVALALTERTASWTRRAAVAALALLTFHLHIGCDVAGSKGPDGSQWPIPYLWPFSDAWQWKVPWQWELDAWPNVAITVAGLLLAGVLAVRRGYSPLELLSRTVDQAVVTTLRQRFAPHRLPAPAADPASTPPGPLAPDPEPGG